MGTKLVGVLVAALLTNQIHKVLHEMGHLLFFKIFGLSFIRLRLGFWEIYKDDETKKICSRIINGFAFSCTCKDLNLLSKPKIIITLLAGGLVNFLLVAVSVPICFIVEMEFIKIWLYWQILWSLFDFVANVINPHSVDRRFIKTLT